jgi:hypothetical protein
MPTTHGGSLAKNVRTSYRRNWRMTVTLPSPVTPWTWKTCFAKSSPIVIV